MDGRNTPGMVRSDGAYDSGGAHVATDGSPLRGYRSGPIAVREHHMRQYPHGISCMRSQVNLGVSGHL